MVLLRCCGMTWARDVVAAYRPLPVGLELGNVREATSKAKGGDRTSMKTLLNLASVRPRAGCSRHSDKIFREVQGARDMIVPKVHILYFTDLNAFRSRSYPRTCYHAALYKYQHS